MREDYRLVIIHMARYESTVFMKTTCTDILPQPMSAHVKKKKLHITNSDQVSNARDDIITAREPAARYTNFILSFSITEERNGKQIS